MGPTRPKHLRARAGRVNRSAAAEAVKELADGKASQRIAPCEGSGPPPRRAEKWAGIAAHLETVRKFARYDRADRAPLARLTDRRVMSDRIG